MQADTNLQNADVCYEVSASSNEDAFVNHFDGLLVAETDVYTLKLNSTKNVYHVTFLDARHTETTTQELGNDMPSVARKQSLDSFFELFDERIKRTKVLRDKFLMNRLSDLGFDFSQINNVFLRVSALKFEDAIVEVSPFNSVIIKLKFDNDILLLINIPEDNLTEDNPTAVFSLLENRKPIVDNYNSIDGIVVGMEAFLDQ